MIYIKRSGILFPKLYKIGDKVKIACIEKLMQSQYRNSDGYMDKYAGTFMTIKDIMHGCYRMQEDYFYQNGVGFFWPEELIEGKMEDYEYYI